MTRAILVLTIIVLAWSTYDLGYSAGWRAAVPVTLDVMRKIERECDMRSGDVDSSGDGGRCDQGRGDSK